MEDIDNLVQFVNQEGSEFVINTETGEAKISNNSAARVLKVDEATIRRYREKLNLTGELVKYRAGNSVQRSALISAFDFYTIALELAPGLAKAMVEMGANSYLLYAAGYKVNVVQPKTSLTNLELAEAAVRLFKLEASTTTLPGLTNINRAHEETDPSALPGYFTVWELLIKQFDYKVTKLLSKTINKRMGQAARLTTAQHRATKKSIEVEKPDGSIKLIAVNKYPTSLLPEFEEILRQVKIEFSIS